MRSSLRALAIMLLLPGTAAAAPPQDLAGFLRAASEMARPPRPLRADGHMETVAPDKTTRDDLIAVLRSNGDLYLETRESGFKALLLGNGAAAYLMTKGGGKAVRFDPNTPFAGSELTREDLQVFASDRFISPGIIDKSPSQLTVQLTPQVPPYSLIVTTFDRDKVVPLKTLYYRDTVSNLVKMRRDAGHVQVAERWLPSTVTMENFAMRTITTLTLKWREASEVPDSLFKPEALPRPSGLSWP